MALFDVALVAGAAALVFLYFAQPKPARNASPLESRGIAAHGRRLVRKNAADIRAALYDNRSSRFYALVNYLLAPLAARACKPVRQRLC